ncbi:hypothetical protein VTK73DRAFT_8860 [Phialemonium thermophilum]|uniref:Cutinase n=1 Tax=Phialemonium thermophilum TaxID=223376 RepID=A0ABR3W5Z2_9PEZI
MRISSKAAVLALSASSSLAPAAATVHDPNTSIQPLSDATTAAPSPSVPPLSGATPFPMSLPTDYTSPRSGPTSTAAAGSSSAPPAATASGGGACPTGLHLIVARGSEEKPGLGRMAVVAGNITERVPGSTVVAVDYPATFEDYPGSEADGVNVTTHLIASYVKQCPKAKIALLGYSQGGQVAMDVICGTSESPFNKTTDLTANYQSNLVAVVTFGDPSHVPGMPWDEGTSKNAGIFPRKDTKACEPYSNIIRGWCDAGDIYCDSGKVRGVHGTYFANYTRAAVDFVVGRYNESLASTTTSSSPSGTSGSPTSSASGHKNGAGTVRPAAQGLAWAAVAAFAMGAVALL